MTKSVAILDIGTGKVSAFVGKRGAGGMLVVEASSECEYSGCMNGKIIDTVSLFTAIDRALTEVEQKVRFTFDGITVGVPGQFTVTECREISYSFEKRHRLTDEDVEFFHGQAGVFDYPGYEQLHVQPVYYVSEDGRKMISAAGVNTKKLSGYISYMFVSSEFKKTVESDIRAHGIEKCDFVSGLLAESVFLIPDAVRDNFAVLIDIGYLSTDVAVVRGDGIIKQFSFALGGGQITKAIVENLDIKYPIAEQIKRKIIFNLAFSDSDSYAAELDGKEYRFNAKDINRAAEGVINKIIRTVAKNIDTQTLPSDAKCFVTGGGIALNTGAGDYFAKNMPLETEVVCPPIPLYEKPDLSGPLAILSLAASL